MLAANYTTVRNNLKDYCDKATDENEIVLVTRKADKNVVIMSLFLAITIFLPSL